MSPLLGVSIAEVIRQTGLSRHVLHKWERRYGVVEPARSASGHRRYTLEQIERLKLLARLTAEGHAIGSIVHMNSDALRALLQRPVDAPRAASEVVRIDVHGPIVAALASMSNDLGGQPGVDLGVHPTLLARPWSAGALHAETDVLVVETEVLGEAGDADFLAGLAANDDREVIVLYHFARSEALQQVLDAGVVCLKAPVNAGLFENQVRQAVARQAEVPAPRHPEVQAPIPPRRFSRESLGRLLVEQHELMCQCPSHLSQLILNLSAFEEYSHSCQNQSPADAELHAHLRWVAASARELVEGALEKVIEADDLDVASRE